MGPELAAAENILEKSLCHFFCLSFSLSLTHTHTLSLSLALPIAILIKL